jgi:hypothetical protein
MNRKSILAFALVGALTATTTVLADLEDFDPATGTGFLGKGDVQSAFGWNNAEAQVNIPYVTLSAELTRTVTQACYTTAQDQHWVVDRHGTQTTDPLDLNWEPRIHHQIDGIYLLGYTDPSAIDWDAIETDWEGPNNGCPDGTHPKFAPTFGPITLGGLFATFDGDTEQVWPED